MKNANESAPTNPVSDQKLMDETGVPRGNATDFSPVRSNKGKARAKTNQFALPKRKK